MAIKKTKGDNKMCFSAGASFAASGVLLVAGISSLKFTTSRRQVPFAAIPLLFAVQQFCEGFVWLSLTNSGYANWANISIYAYLVFAQAFWPAWVPFSIYLLEKDLKRRKILSVFMITGLLAAAYLAYCLAVYEVEASVSSHHIKYMLKFPFTPVFFTGGLYILSTIFPPFVSSVRKMLFLGITILISYMETRLFFGEYIISVWCYFAAVLSIVIWFIMKDLRKNYREIK